MSTDPYLQAILLRETVDTGPSSAVRGAQLLIHALLNEWAGTQLISVTPTGSFAKGTANSSG